MKRVSFVDRMAQGRVSRREILKTAAAFGVGVVMMPRPAPAANTLTVLEWAGYDSEDYFKSYVKKYGTMPAFSIFASEEEALQKVRGGFAADIMHPCNYSVDRFVDAKLTLPIDTSRLSNWEDIFPALQTAAGVVVDGHVVLAPADWGNSSIAYRPDLVDEDFKKNESWSTSTTNTPAVSPWSTMRWRCRSPEYCSAIPRTRPSCFVARRWRQPSR